MTDDHEQFPDWDEDLYNNQKVESMSWYNESLNADLIKELDDMNV